MQPASVKRIAATGFALVIAILALGILVTLQRLDQVASGTIADMREDSREIALAERLRAEGAMIALAERGYLLTGLPEYSSQLRQGEAEFDATMAEIRALPFELRDRPVVAEIERRSDEFRRIEQDVLAMAPRASQRELQDAFSTRLEPAENALIGALDHLAELQRDDITQAYRDARAVRRSATAELLAILSVAVVMALAVGWLVTRELSRMARRERAARTAAEHAVAARNQVMGIVAHDLRDPLGAIVLKSELLARDVQGTRAQRQAEAIANIAMRTEYLIKGMLDVGAIESHRFVMTPTRCDLSDLVQSTTAMFEEAAEAKGVRFAVHTPPHLVVRADREQMLRAMSILAGNAIRFSPEGGTVSITAERTDGEVRIAFSDLGPGITGDHLAHVFDRFGEDSARTKNGVALGLFVAQGIARAHGGRMWAESASGQGVTIHFTLPVDKAPAAAAA